MQIGDALSSNYESKLEDLHERLSRAKEGLREEEGRHSWRRAQGPVVRPAMLREVRYTLFVRSVKLESVYSSHWSVVDNDRFAFQRLKLSEVKSTPSESAGGSSRARTGRKTQ